ncbi:MAG: glycosyltransferase [bacterium]|nr:glycosyltransferase [bacterium]
MRIVQITPGTGTFYCGNCVRDNALVRTLRAMGHDAVMLPMYLPLMTEGDDTSDGAPLFLGGVNVYLQQHVPLFRYTPRWIDRWFDSRGLLLEASKKAGMTKARDLGEMTLSSLSGENGPQRKEINRLTQWLKETPRPDVICLSNALLMGLAPALRRELRCPVVCTLQGEDGFLDSLPAPFNEQCWAKLRDLVSDIGGFIPVSRYYAGVMRDRMRIPDEKIFVVPNGIALEGYRDAERPGDSRSIGYLARMCPDKGLHELVDAFILLKQKDGFHDLQLRAAGTVTAGDEEFLGEQRKKLERHGFHEHAEFRPNVSRDEKLEMLHSIHLFSAPARYGEAFGLYVIEAMAAGAPVVQPRHAGFIEIIESTGGGVLYDGDEPHHLAAALEELLLDLERVRALGERGRRSVMELFSIERMAKEVLEAYHAICAAHAPALGF